MTRISSHSTFFWKRGFPAIWFGFLGFVVCAVAVDAIAKQQLAPLIPLIGIVSLMALIGYAVMKVFVFDLVDEAWDCGDSILVRYKGREHRFALSDFMNVSYSGFVNPPRVALTLREASEDFGPEVAFVPPFRPFPFSMHPIAQDLMTRIDASRRLP